MTLTNSSSGLLPNPPPGGILSDIRTYLKNIKAPDYRFRQVVSAFQQGIEFFEELEKLPKDLRGKLVEKFGDSPLPLKPTVIHSADQVDKVLFETKSRAKIETVLSRYRKGWSSMCISSQSGCGLGCSFCATAAMGLMKNLSADEVCAQIFHPYWKGKLPDSIAFMGMGEALANSNIFNAIDAITQKGYGGLSQRRITVSTVGFAPNLEKLISYFPQVNITLSVHSPFPSQRAELIPLENRFSLENNLAILDEYISKYKRKVYLAYLLIEGVNDTQEHCESLIAMVKARIRPELYHLSIIRYNTAWGANPSYRQPSNQKVNEFVAQLNKKGIHASRRTQFGSQIGAACGQLHADYTLKNSKKGISD